MHYYHATYTVTETMDFGVQCHGPFNCTVKADSTRGAKSLVIGRARKNMSDRGCKGELTIEVEIMETVGY